MTCKMCIERGKAWEGSDPHCAFDGEFSDNWNCATLNAIRDICYEGQDPMPGGVDYRYCDDQKYATIYIDDIEIDDKWLAEALWVSWYKNRGRTDAVWLLNSSEAPRQPTEQECLAIIRNYKQRTNNQGVKNDKT